MTWNIIASKSAQKALRKMPAHDNKKILTWINKKGDNNALHRRFGSKKLRGYDNKYRKRIGNYRVIFDVIKNKVIIYITDIRRRTTTTYRR